MMQVLFTIFLGSVFVIENKIDEIKLYNQDDICKLCKYSKQCF